MKYTNFIFFFLFFLNCKAYCQRLSDASYNSLNNENSISFTEKMFVHTDKNFYVAGEILWFKMYCVEAASNKLSDLSKIAYVELLDSTNKPILQAKIALRNGLGDGSFYLPLSAPSGNYKLRSYTNWMKNGSAVDFFQKQITLINVQKLTVDSSRKSKALCRLQFFPEGGNLVKGVSNRLAFKGTNQNGNSFVFTGILMDDKDTLLSFRSTQAGIGNFVFTPKTNHAYTVFIQPEKGNAFAQNLPIASDEGFAMMVDSTSDSNALVNVAASNMTAQTVYLVIHKNKQTILAKEVALQNGKAAFNINTLLLPGGVSTITIFNESKQPVCERLYYKKGAQTLQLSLRADATSYEVRKKVNLTMQADNFTYNNDSAQLSLSVYRLDSLQTLDNNTIDAYLLFASDIKENDENVLQDFLLQQESENTINNLLLVNGWRKIGAKTNIHPGTSVLSFAPEYNGHIITGKLTNNQTGKPQQGVIAYLSLPGKSTQFYTSMSDSFGNIKWETKDWYGTSKLIVQTDQLYDSSYSFSISYPFSNQFSSSVAGPFSLPFNSSNTLLQHSIAMQVQNIYGGNHINQFATPVADSTAFYTSADKRYRLDDYTRFTTTEEVLREYVSLVNVTKRKGEYHFPTYDMSAQSIFTADPLVLVDGIPFFNLNKFIAFDPLQLKTLDVVNRRYIYGNAVFDGILNCQTYTADGTGVDIDPHALVMDYDGLQEQRTFYSPAYETFEKQNNHLPDFRTTLLWKPNITLHKNEQKQIPFFTSDLPGRYAVVVQGISTNGLCCSRVAIIDVAKQ